MKRSVVRAGPWCRCCRDKQSISQYTTDIAQFQVLRRQKGKSRLLENRVSDSYAEKKAGDGRDFVTRTCRGIFEYPSKAEQRPRFIPMGLELGAEDTVQTGGGLSLDTVGYLINRRRCQTSHGTFVQYPFSQEIQPAKYPSEKQNQIWRHSRQDGYYCLTWNSLSVDTSSTGCLSRLSYSCK